MATILPIQGRFDKEIPEDFGNAEYRQECELLIAIDQIITTSGLEYPVIEYFLDVAYVNKYISVFGTDKSANLTSNERLNVHVNAVIALRMAILRKRLHLSLRKFSLALSHNVTDKLDAAIKNAHERIIGQRQVANEDKILSIYENEVNVIVRRKAGAEVEFGNTLYLAALITRKISKFWNSIKSQNRPPCKKSEFRTGSIYCF